MLQKAGVRKLIDVRLKKDSQLAGFAKRVDLEFFLKRLNDCAYEHRPEWSPTKELLDGYKKKKITWDEYVPAFKVILEERKVSDDVVSEDLDRICLLCSEAKPEKCHRRLVAEYLSDRFGDIEIMHL